MAEPLRVLVAGAGMTGGRFVDEVLARTADDRAHRPVAVTVIGGEPYAPYNRVLLSDVVAGRADVGALALGDVAGWTGQGVDVRLGDEVVALDLPPDPLLPGRARTASGAVVEFDRVVLATGAEPVIPTVEGVTTGRPATGVHTLRTVDDARSIVAAAANARSAVVLGGGVLGVEVARGLARRELRVTVHADRQLLAGRVDAAAAAVLTRTLRGLGVSVRTQTTSRSAGDGSAGRTSAGAAAGHDSTRDEVDADLVVVACGVRPRTELARSVGLGVRRGVLVDDALVTSDPRVLAIGDCAEHDGQVAGLVAPGWEQARVAADVLTAADPAARYHGQRPVLRLKAADVELTALGDTDVDPWDDDPGVDVVQLLDPSAGRYVKAVVRDGIVVGCVSVGDARVGADLALMVDRGTPAPPDRAVLVSAPRGAQPSHDDPTRIPDRATVCRCNGVTKAAIVRAWSAGARSVAGVADRTRATTGCGSCRDAVQGLLGWLAASDPDPADAEPGPQVPRPIPTGGLS
ncbi:MAG: FAD-dependent oxidoreductase [Angustibacter sp.]